ncbi:hypothetical protein ZMO1_ZMO0796 [Zymomonas mobilis subsp. mobilis ZM4 = ATCC 31821]|uniref:Uncharacterized protein n=2 Tax=Zymomonas mobilis subsp. mobilis TaxID=120045 RepID=Q5NPE0_ZYMMO|nr:MULTISPECIES: hypothetical protein [Zymomonas]AFN56393.1 hypothetical protein ZZ6_0494 [Zymomonas mobilis subsp. mobilis ATCC 29191]AAV89420.1 hypothetical protein ZMO0796 [Zymomonas mobilis subsp. mobilis ZM4 = ATCC 31821]AEH62340.1 conserved hypothetical protein [Zymomonas mobilis subsp. mobilis ATCC 10988]AVZ25729.1 hypothetical protein ZMO2_ZMO0796 [Zymomonas mobilis subsp. mobilis]AVZ27620.1 hypothetical protein ZMO3_ZMO0796 [Zymomonas mobilis subsp. mobilis]
MIIPLLFLVTDLDTEPPPPPALPIPVVTTTNLPPQKSCKVKRIPSRPTRIAVCH